MLVFGKKRLLSFFCAVNNVKARLDLLSGESFLNSLHKQRNYFNELLKDHFTINRIVFRSSLGDQFGKIVVLNILTKCLEKTY